LFHKTATRQPAGAVAPGVALEAVVAEGCDAVDGLGEAGTVD
jgi:hypothetical protein